MRITNKIMQNNSLSNINTNKILQDKLNTQITTEKKITRPSDDPVIAIRALRLRGTLSELTQYHDKNASDAESWLKVTEGALGTAVSIIDDMYEQCNKGASDDMNVENRKAMLTALKNLQSEFYSAGDVDFAGRNVFTGYRTSTKLTFQEDTSRTYRITEQLSWKNIDTITYINTKNLADVNEHNYNDGNHNVVEEDITDKEVARIRLGYTNLDHDSTPQITDHAGNSITYTNPTGTSVTVTVQTKSLYGTANPYETLKDDEAFFVPETGELLLGKNVKEKLASMTDNPLTQGVDESELRISYDKTDWKKGDLNPVNYYACSTVDRTVTGTNVTRTETMKYNGGWQTGEFKEQVIEYDVGFNQKLRVNSTAGECFNQDIGRDVGELIAITEQVGTMEAVRDALKEIVAANETDADAEARLDAAEKALTKLKDKMQKMFSAGMTKFKAYQDNVNKANTNCGTRSARLDLIKDRLKSQLTTFDELASENENADTVQLTIELSSAELSYEAALLATGKIVQTTLLNFL